LIWRGASEVAYKLKNVRNAKHGTEIFSQPLERGVIGPTLYSFPKK
jgi:hypothetical protein